MNGVNLKAIQYDFDLTWMAFFQNSDGQTYARYGGREDDGPETHLTKASLTSTMQRVLMLHSVDGAKPWSKYEPKPVGTFTPEQIPPMKKMMSKRKETCIHCHDIKHAQLADLHNRNQLTKYMVYGYPSPRQVGIELDANDQTKIANVATGSAAAKAGIQPGDVVSTVDGQRVLTYADFTRVLELAPENGTVDVQVQRTGRSRNFKLPLSSGWRKSPDPSWRPSTGVVGPNTGFWGRLLTEKELGQKQLDGEKLALRVVVVWGAWAKEAGVRVGDVVVELDGITSKKTIKQLQTHLQMNKDFGDTVKLTVLRKGKKQPMAISLPDKPEE